MIRYALIVLTLFALQDQACAQRPRKERVIKEGDRHQSELPLHYLYRGITYDYVYGPAGNLFCDIGHHIIVTANNENALGSVNQIYIPMGDVIEVRDIQARTISKDGRVVELDENNIKEISDEASDGGYRIFAMEGAEVGGQLEYSYVMRTRASTFVWQTVQYEAPTQLFEFQLKSPENLIFEFQVVNHEAEMVETDTVDDTNIYQLILTDVPGYSEEPFTAGEANKIRVEGKLAYNTYAGGRRLNTFSDAGRKIFERAHRISKEEEKAIATFLKQYRRSELDPIDQLKHYEHEAKIRLYEEEYASDKVDDLFTNRFGQGRAFLKLFVAVLEELDIAYEIVTTCERSKARFDPSFDNWKYLDDFLIYLPEEEEYLAPHHSNYRYGSIPPELSAQKGLFVKNELITDFSYPVSRMAEIPAASYKANITEQELRLSFDEDLTQNQVEAKFSYHGDNASNYKTALHWTTEEQRAGLLADMFEHLAGDAELTNVGINQAAIDAEGWHEPFVASAVLQTMSYIERAGPALLFKLGEVIGRQAELYQESDRRFDIENVNNHGYFRSIQVALPKGFAVHNLEDIRMEEVVMDDDEEVFAFRSDYQMIGNVLEISIEEYYNRISFPKERFEEFRRVINAAADWNNIILVLRPNG